MKWSLLKNNKMSSFQKIVELLSKEHITHRVVVHETIPRDSFEASKIRKSDVTKGAKALILENDQKELLQVVVPAHQKVNIKELQRIAGKKRIKLASPEKVFERTNCVVGSVPPLGILWSLPVFIDTSFTEEKEIVFSAGTLTDSIYLQAKNLITLNNATVGSFAKDH